MIGPPLTVLIVTTWFLLVRTAPTCVTGRSDDRIAFNAGGESMKQLKFGAENPKYFVGSSGAVHITNDKVYTPPKCPLSLIYATERYTKQEKLVYSIPVPEGVYTVVTMHAEIYYNAAGKRKFHIDVNGDRKRTDLDIFADAGGKNKGIKLAHHNIKSMNGTIEIAFLKSVENPQVSGFFVEGKGAGKIATGCCDSSCPRAVTPKGKTSNEVLPDIIDITAPPKPLDIENVKMKDMPVKIDNNPSPQPSNVVVSPPTKTMTPEIIDISIPPKPLTKNDMNMKSEANVDKKSTPQPSNIVEPKPTTTTKPTVVASEPSTTSQLVRSEPAMNPTSEPAMSVSSKPTKDTTMLVPTKSNEMAVEPKSLSSSSGCGDGKYIFCEDFEDLKVGKTERTGKWVLDGKASIAVSPVRKSKALYLDPSGAGGEKGRLIVKGGISAPGNSMYGRMRVWVKEFATEPPYAHFVMAEMFKADSGGGEAESGTEKLRPVGGQFVPNQGSLWGIGSDGGATGDWTQHRPTAKTVDAKWTCVEWSMMQKNSEIKFWIDGVLKPEMTVDVDQHDGGHGKLVFPKIDSAWFGWWVFQGDAKPSKFDVYLDDIALAETRIGC